jgi:hypothetical protein
MSNTLEYFSLLGDNCISVFLSRVVTMKKKFLSSSAVCIGGWHCIFFAVSAVGLDARPDITEYTAEVWSRFKHK